MEDNRKWFWFETYVNGEKCFLNEHWFTSMENIFDVSRRIAEKARRFNKSANIRIKVVEDTNELECVAICDFDARKAV